jgi:hypothetical protein
MNERIQELARVAEQLADDELAHLERLHNRLYSFTESREIYNQKFAELIVRECKKAIDPTGDLTSMSEAGWRKACMKMIDERFGVEE